MSKILAERIRILRKSQNLTQEKLAELSNIDPKTIVSIESGKRVNPTLKTLNKLAKALKTSTEELLRK